MNALPQSATPMPPAPRPAVSFARMLVLAQRRFRANQPNPAAA